MKTSPRSPRFELPRLFQAKHDPPRPKIRLANVHGGFALVIVLAFLVLLTGLVLAFFSTAMSDHGVSNSAANWVKVEIFARGATNTVVGELKKEIVDGSIATTVANPNGSTTFYAPKTAADAVPKMVGSSGTGGAENLLKVSQGSLVSSTTPSKNGRFISKARWNKPLLLPVTSATDPTPLFSAGSFTPPAWVLVARDGSQPTTWNANLSASGTNPVLGRYAYAIYDEGGLLDANLAGCPSTATTAHYAYKPALAYADLKQLGLTASQIDQLVTWRNSATTQTTGTVKTPAFTAAAGTNYFNSVTLNSNGFLKVGGTGLSPTNQSDRMFTSRQELMSFLQSGLLLTPSSTPTLQGVLRYLGTFSRDINQPSFRPDPVRPVPKGTDVASGFAGNDAVGVHDDFNPAFLSITAASSFVRNDGSIARIGEPLVNKRFALNRLAWLTYKGPSAARTLTDTDMVALQNYGIPAELLAQGNDANIYKYFGLTWNATGQYWTYDHAIKGSAGTTIVGYLKKVNAAAREADFFELLKTGINCGSIAKGATAPPDTNANFALQEGVNYIYDTTLDYSILQIGANIISQFSTDGYPVRIRFNNGTLQEFRGVENLPYFYRMRNGIVISRMPAPVLPGQQRSAGTNPSTNVNSTPVANGTLTDSGSYAELWEPEIWNPHDINSSTGSPKPPYLRIIVDSAPLQADGALVSGSTRHSYTINSRNRVDLTHDYYSRTATATYPAGCYYGGSGRSASVTYNGDDTALVFDNAAGAYREPTLLVEPNVPAGSNLRLGANNMIRTVYADTYLSTMFNGTGITALNDKNNPYANAAPSRYLGIFHGTGPLAWQETIAGVISVIPAKSTFFKITGSYPPMTVRVQYSDNQTDWFTYDQKYTSTVDDIDQPGGEARGTKLYLNDGVLVKDNLAIGAGAYITTPDPRTRTWGNPGNQNFLSANYAGMSWATPGIYSTKKAEVDGVNNTMRTERYDTGVEIGWYSAIADQTNSYSQSVPQVGGWFPPIFPSKALSNYWASTSLKADGSFGGSYGGLGPMTYRTGMLTQNNPYAPSDNAVTDPLTSYYGDPDGVVRRAMGGYVTFAATGNVPANTRIGLPMATAMTGFKPTAFYTVPATQSQSRPWILNRPFRSVAELGYVFTGTPWKNLSMSTPESGAAPLLDVFCIQVDDTADAVVAGKVNLNTKNPPVLAAVLSQAYKDEFNLSPTLPANYSAQMTAVANLLISRTSDLTTAGKGPLRNLSEIVGKYSAPASLYKDTFNQDGTKAFTGFSSDLTTLYGVGGTYADATTNNIFRFREAFIRPLANCGTARVWNLMIDLTAQTGRYPKAATGLANFVVEGEVRYWLHVAIDRQTGNVIDQQVELVKE